MNRKLYLVLGLIGVAGFAFGLTRMWTGFHLKLADKFMGTPGYELLMGQIGIGLALAATALLFVSPKLAAVPGALMVGCCAFAFFFPKTENHLPQLGIYISGAAAMLIVISSFMVPMRHPRR